MSNRFSIYYLFLAIVLFSCSSQEAVKEEEAQKADTSQTGDLVISHGLLEYAGIEYGYIRKQRLSSDVSARGELVLPVNARIDVGCLYPGIVKTIYFNQGDPVTKGQVMATISSAEFIEAQKQYLMVKNQMVMLEQEYERQKELNKDKITSDKYYQKALSDFNVAKAELKGLALQLEMAGISEKNLESGNIKSAISISSPINGFIENININPGKYVNPDECLFRVINRDHLLIELNVFEKDILKVFPGQRVTFALANMSEEVHEAEIISVGNSVQKEARVVKVLAEFHNEGGRLLPGMFVSSEIHTGEDEVNALPEEAILRMDDDYYIIFYTTEEMRDEKGVLFKSVQVKIGNSEDGYIAIEPMEEIPADAMVVVKGGYYLKTEQAKRED